MCTSDSTHCTDMFTIVHDLCVQIPEPGKVRPVGEGDEGGQPPQP
jgi:hypothetical protein